VLNDHQNNGVAENPCAENNRYAGPSFSYNNGVVWPIPGLKYPFIGFLVDSIVNYFSSISILPIHLPYRCSLATYLHSHDSDNGFGTLIQRVSSSRTLMKYRGTRRLLSSFINVTSSRLGNIGLPCRYSKANVSKVKI